MRLTDEEIDAIEERIYCKTIQKGKTRHVYFQQFARAIEAAVVERCAQICDAEATVEGIAQKCATAIREQT